MATRKRSAGKADETLVDIGQVRNQARNFWSRYQNIMLSVIAGIAIVIGGVFAYRQFVTLPKQKEAVEQMHQAEFMFERDSFQQALNNPGGGYAGFLQIIEKYKGSEAANLAHYYAGVCYLNLGQADEAIKYLSDYSPKGSFMPVMKYGTLGDAYSEKEDLDKAVSFYEKAAKAGDDELLTPYYLKKLGLLQSRQGKSEAALKTFEQIKEKYPDSPDGSTIDKYIARLSAATM